MRFRGSFEENLSAFRVEALGLQGVPTWGFMIEGYVPCSGASSSVVMTRTRLFRDGSPDFLKLSHLPYPRALFWAI